MSGYNSVVILGRLTGPPEQLTSKNGKAYLRAVVATSVYRQNSDGKGEQRAAFVPVTIFGKTAETFLKYVQRGDMVHLDGRLDSNEWKTESGEKRLTLSFVAEQLSLLPNERAKPMPPEENRQREPDLNEYGEPNEISF